MPITPSPATQTAPQVGADGTKEAPAASTLAPPPEPTTTATSQPDGPSAEELAATEAAKAEAAKAATVVPPKRDYAAERTQQRIDKLTAQLAESGREIAKLKGTQTTDAAAIQAQITEQAGKLAQVEAAKIATWKTFTDGLNDAIDAGKKEFGAEKFDKSVEALRPLLDKNDPEAEGRYLSMLQAALDTGAASKLILILGEDPNEAARIMSLTPTKMGVELGKLAFRDADGVSGAPKPITPVSGVGRTHVAIAAEDPERSDSIDMRVWMERRGQHVAEVNKRAGRRIIP
jgi:hypothetical protein